MRARTPPLVVDLDGTLVHCDLLHEAMVKLAVADPLSILQWPGWLLLGRARFKREVALRVTLDVPLLPYQEELLAWIRGERDGGRQITLCTAADERFAASVSAHLGLFDQVMASNGSVNLAAAEKAAMLVGQFGARGFDYAGNSAADVAVWSEARHAIVVGASPRVRRKAAAVTEIEREFGSAPGGIRTWMRALRLYQWVKNLLVFLPVVGAHQIFNVPVLLLGLWAFIAFGLCASATYLLNDMADIDSDRRHPRKRLRPFASGVLTIPQGVAACVCLIIAAFALAISMVALEFAAWLGVYLVTTLCYTFWLKRKMLVDSLVLAGLYTLRVLAGSAAVQIETGFWLLAFSLFFFLSLAMVKRYSELSMVLMRGDRAVPGRDYVVDDRHLVETLGVTSGFCAVMVMALYINDEAALRLYPNQQLIWLTIPVLLYWISRCWLKAHRGEMHEDPVVFALSDGLSRVTIALFFAALVVASIPL
ncbi:MAG: UbiA family prenyltransferase [Proteobacteria bacterium]|nr:UbiA family prenyltransferase [Burkholderiales bacterium]